jgi:tetratricopeptide (TPR) repeat protein
LEEYFWSQVHQYATKKPGPGFVDAVQILEPDMGNIGSLATKAVQNNPSPQIVEIILKVSQFMSWTHPSTHLLNEVRVLVKEIGTSIQEGKVLQFLGNILCRQGKYTEASEALTKAQEQFIKIGKPLGAAQCSQSLGNILHMQGKYTEASEALTEAQEQFIKIGEPLGAAQYS